MGNYIFTLTPTFTQGLVLGQLSILLLVYFILKYLFFDSKSVQTLEESSEDTPLFRPSFSAEKFIATTFLQTKVKKQEEERDEDSVESAEWLNVLLKQVSCRVAGNGPGLAHEAWVETVKDRRRIPMQVGCYGRRVGRGEGRSQTDTGPGKRSPASGIPCA